MLIELSGPIAHKDGKYYGVSQDLLKDLLADEEIKPFIQAAIIAKNYQKLVRIEKVYCKGCGEVTECTDCKTDNFAPVNI